MELRTQAEFPPPGELATCAPPERSAAVTPADVSFTVELVGERLAGVLHLPDRGGRAVCVLACHGLSASKDSDKYLLLADELTRAGIAFARFDFRGCGESTGIEADTTVATRIEDAQAVLAHLAGHPALTGRFGLLGSSLGGFVALHVARARGDAPPLVTWNAPDDLRRLSPPTSPAIGAAFRADVVHGRYACAPDGLSCHLILQSALDDVVPPSEAPRLRARAAAPAELVLIAGADHRLSDAAHRADAAAASVEWFLKYL